MSILPNEPGAKKLPGDKRPQRVRALAMCILIADGKSLRKAALAEGLDHSEFLHMVAKDDEVRILYETARNVSAEERIGALDEEADAVMQVAKVRGKKASAYVSAFVAKANIAKWKAERLMGKVYGNRVDINHSGSIDLASRLSAARARTKP